MLQVTQIPALQDNYIFAIHDNATHEVIIVDPSCAEPVLAFLKENQLTLHAILLTHHHPDHINGVPELKKQTGCTVYGFEGDAHRLPALDVMLQDNQNITLFGHHCHIFFTPGHTLGHICYYFQEDDIVFCGDTLFIMGCGKLFEGTPLQMFNSHKRLCKLPNQTLIYCAHEYTLRNAEFALTVEPHNTELQERYTFVEQQRKLGLSTIPSTIAKEKATNPFLRVNSIEIQQHLNLLGAEPLDIFTELRKRKDSF